ncbi:MAG: ABC transporter permease [Dehalococcoidales bacterium]|nr:ABC transporter permease [Dehalococcoidales bacterium]
MFAPRWRKVFRDLSSNKTKTILVMLAIAVGVFAFGSVFITQDVLVKDMDTQYRAINTSSISISMAPFDEDVVRWAERQPEVADVQGQAFYTIKLITAADSYNLFLYAYGDYSDISMNKVTPVAGQWPPARREIVIERASLSLSKAQINDKVLVETSDGKRHELTVVGTVHDLNALPANMFPMPTGYVSLETMEWLGLPGLCNQLNIIARDGNNDIPALETAAYAIREKLEDQGLEVYSTTVRKVDDHWAKEVTESFILILSAIGIFSLILSGFLVVNTVTALLTQQRRQIGIIKAIGGTGRQIIGLYLVLVAFYGLLALLLALPVSMGLGYFFTSMVANLLNIDIIGFNLPLRVFLLEAAAALLVPVVAAALPILGGVRVSVRETISDHGIAGKRKADLFDRMLMRVRLFPRPVLLSLRNTFRRKARLALTMGTLILAGTLFIGVMNVRSSLMADLSRMFDKYYNYEVALYLDGNYAEKGVETRVMRLPGVTDVEGWTGASVQRIKADDTKGASFNMVGLPPETKFMNPDLLSGRWLQPGDRNAIVLTSGIVKEMPEVKVGDTITLNVYNHEYEWEVVGIMPMIYDRLGYADFNYLSRIKGTSGLASTLYIATEQKDGASQSAMAETLENQLKKSGVKVGGAMTRNTIAASLTGRNDFLIYFLLIMAIMSAVIGGLGLMGMMSLNVLERTREIGIIRSIGASTRSVGSIVVTEGLIIGMMSWVLAIPLSIPASMGFDAMLGQIMGGQPIPFVFSPLGLVEWLGIVVAISVVASMLPALRAMRMSVRETLAYE